MKVEFLLNIGETSTSSNIILTFYEPEGPKDLLDRQRDSKSKSLVVRYVPPNTNSTTACNDLIYPERHDVQPKDDKCTSDCHRTKGNGVDTVGELHWKYFRLEPRRNEERRMTHQNTSHEEREETTEVSTELTFSSNFFQPNGSWREVRSRLGPGL